MDEANPYIVGVRFHSVSKVYHFDASSMPDVTVGDFVIVSTSRGRQLGKVVQTFDSPPPQPEEGWKPIERKATPRDLVLRQYWQIQEEKVVEFCLSKVKELELSGVKIAGAEFNIDGSRLTLYCNNESAPKKDLTPLREALQERFPETKVELRLIGARDVAKLLSGMGSCGLETRCCAKFLTVFNPISVKMAKAQQISLTTMEITGMCGRLRCCMAYEYESYEDSLKTMPKRGKRVMTPLGEGKVITVYPLKKTVLVCFADNTYREYEINEIEPWSEAEAQRRKQLAAQEIEEEEEKLVELLEEVDEMEILETFEDLDVVESLPITAADTSQINSTAEDKEKKYPPRQGSEKSGKRRQRSKKRKKSTEESLSASAVPKTEADKKSRPKKRVRRSRPPQNPNQIQSEKSASNGRRSNQARKTNPVSNKKS
jgi:cell fate regulator YaaT (PSP1 superfamily)